MTFDQPCDGARETMALGDVHRWLVVQITLNLFLCIVTGCLHLIDLSWDLRMHLKTKISGGSVVRKTINGNIGIWNPVWRPDEEIACNLHHIKCCSPPLLASSSSMILCRLALARSMGSLYCASSGRSTLWTFGDLGDAWHGWCRAKVVWIVRSLEPLWGKCWKAPYI